MSPFLLIGFLMLAFLLIRRQWRSAAVKREEVLRLISLATEESYLAAQVKEEEARAATVNDYYYGSSSSSSVPAPHPPPDDDDVYRCAVCLRPTTTRCSQCKSVRYCSSKCQILHWRRGHKEECRSPSLPHDEKELNTELPSADGLHGSETHDRVNNDDGVSVDLACDVSMSRPSVQKVQARPEAVDFTTSLNKKDNFYESRPISRKKSRPRTEKTDSARKHSTGKAALSTDAKQQSSRRSVDTVQVSASNHLFSVEHQGEKIEVGHGKTTFEPSSSVPSATLSSSAIPLPSKAKVSQAASSSSSGLKTSMQKVVQHFRPPKSSKLTQPSTSVNEMSFSYEMFVKLYRDRIELQPFGLVNLGNSCYANVVLQCLAFTRPLISYLIRGIHSKACRKKSWCFVCEFEFLILKSRGGESPLSPIKILSRLQKIGKHLGPGKQEDAHEFLRCAVDTMQSVFLKEADAAGSFAEETTLVGLTFGGYLHSKIKCMKCLHKSERTELMMDLTVEIGGDIGSLEEALAQFTAYEVLDGENRYLCDRCKSYQKAKKKLMILEGPNILTVVLKRFQSDNFGKLSKPIHFPQLLDISPYMSNPSHGDHQSVYSLYAVVVHLDATSFSGHYVCYIKNLHGDWFKIDDSNVFAVPLETVLLEGAYMLLYARDSPRPVSKNGVGRKSKERRNLSAIPSRHDNNTKKKQEKDSSSSVLPRVDLSSGSLSSLFSSSETTSSCSTKDSSGFENLSEYLFGGVDQVWNKPGSS
ncbi:Ubiquitin carboxyl-terminal hydrolase 17 [Hirschfeldia incana]|nr:Ubiquitin carboxyl-terminal hydrolase 17 [Hirschfeldia incana]